MQESLESLVDTDKHLREAMDEHRAAIAELRAERCAAIATARAAGHKPQDIAEALGITKALVYEMLAERRKTSD